DAGRGDQYGCGAAKRRAVGSDVVPEVELDRPPMPFDAGPGTRTVDADAALDASPERDSPARAVEHQPVEPSVHPPQHHDAVAPERHGQCAAAVEDRKSTRLNSSHRTISYAVFCLKKKKRRH